MVETQEFKVRPLMSYKKPMGDTQEFKARPGGAKIVQVSAEPSLPQAMPNAANLIQIIPQIFVAARFYPYFCFEKSGPGLTFKSFVT